MIVLWDDSHKSSHHSQTITYYFGKKREGKVLGGGEGGEGEVESR